MKQGVKIGIAVAALLAAVGVYFVFGGSAEEKQLVSDETKTLWMCAGCSDVAEMTAKQVETAAKETGPPAPPMICHKCKEKKVYRALRCEKCQTVYFGSDVPDQSGQCPKCNPDAKPPPPEVEEEAPAPTEDENATDKPEAGPVKKVKRPKAA